MGAETFSVIGQAMADAGTAGIGTVTLSRRERMVMVEPREAGLVLTTLRAADEVRGAHFEGVAGVADPEAVVIAEMIIRRRSGVFDPSLYRDRYQEALRELIDAKLKGRKLPTPATAQSPQVLDLMAAPKRSLAESEGAPAIPTRPRKKSAGSAATKPPFASIGEKRGCSRFS